MNKKGFGIAETLIAGLMLSMVGTAFLAVNSAANINNRLGYQRAVAADLAQGVAADLQYELEKGWKSPTNPLALGGEPSPWDANLSTYSPTPRTIDGVNYQITVNYLSVGDIKLRTFTGGTGPSDTATSLLTKRVEITVSWPSAPQYKMYTIVSNWRAGLL